jgi:hypothetical protein
MWISNRWYDHGDSQLRNFLKTIGLSDDLLDKSRAEENAHISACVTAALAFLDERGGTYVMEPAVEARDLPPAVYDGLFYAIDTKQVGHKWGKPGEGDTWTTLALSSKDAP